MESTNSASCEAEAQVKGLQDNEPDHSTDQWFSERFESLLPKIQERWPDVAKQTLEATRGSLDEVIRVIAKHSDRTTLVVQDQLEDLFHSASDHTQEIAQNLEPLEKQLEELLDDLNSTLRPKIEKPIKQRPLMAIGLAAGIGILLGLLLSGGKKSQ